MLSESIPNEVTSVDCLCGPGPVSDMDRSLVIGIQVRATCLAVCHHPVCNTVRIFLFRATVKYLFHFT